MPFNIPQDTIILFVFSLIGWVIKLKFKPSKAEFALVSNILLILVQFIVGWLRKHSANHKGSLNDLHTDVAILRNKIAKGKIVLG